MPLEKADRDIKNQRLKLEVRFFKVVMKINGKLWLILAKKDVCKSCMLPEFTIANNNKKILNSYFLSAIISEGDIP